MSRQRKESIQLRSRLSFVLFLFTVFMSVITSRVFYIKIVHGEEYTKKAMTQQTNNVDRIINPNRGSILDRNKQTLAVSKTVYNVILDPRVLAKLDDTKEKEKAAKETTITEISRILEIPQEKLRGYIQVGADGKPAQDTSYLPIKKKVSGKVADEIKGLKLKGVWLEEDTKRSYTYDTYAAQVIGFMRGDSKWGIEKFYDDLMKGVPGRTFRTLEEDNNAVTQQIPPRQGYSVVTTIDQVIQGYSEEIAQEAGKKYEAEHASVLVMNPNTGEVISMAAYPTFNLNNPTEKPAVYDPAFDATWRGMSEEDKLTYMNRVWNNFNIVHTFEPGSIFKPMVIAAALEENIISPQDTFFCGGSLLVAGSPRYCWNHQGHGDLNAEGILANSCNVGMMHIAAKMGRDIFYKYEKDFGFGEKTGIDLPAEASSDEPLIYSKAQLNVVELATSSFGQGFNCTPIQVVNAFAAVINGGKLMKPYVVSQVIDANGNLVKENTPKVQRKVISQETSDMVRRYLKTVVDTGTGKKAKIEGYAIGGKTGTAQQAVRVDEQYTITFMAFLPVENPQYIALVLIDKPKPYIEGSGSAAPMLRELLEKIISYKAIEPSNEIKKSDNKQPTEPNTVVVDNYIGRTLLEATNNISDMDLDYELVGSGTVVTNQVQKAGSQVPKGTKIILYITKGDDSKNLTTIPDVIGLTKAEAVEKIKAANLIPICENDTQAQAQAGGQVKAQAQPQVQDTAIVVSQLPESGAEVETGIEIKLKFDN